MSAELTGSDAGRAGMATSGLVARLLIAVVGFSTASGWAFPLSAWFRDFTCFTLFAFYILISSTGWHRGRLFRLAAAAGMTAAIYLCTLVQAAVPRLALLAWILTSEFWVERSPGGKRRGRGGWLLFPNVAAGGLLALALVYQSAPGLGVRGSYVDAAAARRPVSVALYSEGLLDWEVPSPERPGLVRSGMFGLFRKSLERYAAQGGGEVITVDSLAASSLSGIDLMVFINPTRALSRAEGEWLAGFVARGGGLLVLGDHTDIGGSLAPLNSALESTSIRFNFDSAMSLRERWVGCLDIRTHPVTAGVRDEVDAQVGVGASLEISPPAFPVVVGRFAFSDRGDYENGGRGANMGNRRRDDGEAFMNLVLVAGEEAGSGRVLVFGDTSPFQNGARFLSQRLVANAVEWLCRRDGAGTLAGFNELRPFEDVAVIDFSLNPAVSRALFTERSLGGLANCLCRAGLTPVPGRGLPPAGADMLLLVAPTRSLSPGKTRGLMGYMRSGGRLILAKGYSAPQPCCGLLAQLCFEILPVPLGNGDRLARVRHKEAWAVAYSGAPDTTVHASAFGHPTVVTKPVGKGSFTLITDGRLLLDANLESETTCVPENVKFIAALFHELRKDGHGLVSSDGLLARDNPD